MSTNVSDKNGDAVREVNEDEYSYKPRSRAKETSKKKKPMKINKLAVIIPLCAILVFCVAVITFSMTLPKNKIAGNVYAGDIDLSGKSESEAAALIEGLIDENTVFTVTSSGKSAQITAAEINVVADAEETAKEALKVGKSKNIFKNAYDAVKLLTGKEYIDIKFNYDDEKLDNALFEFGTSINGVSTEPEYEFGDNSMTIIPPSPGQSRDVSVAKGEFLNSVSKGIFNNIEVTLEYADTDKLNVNSIYNEVCKEPQDASYENTEDGKIIVNEHSVGVKLDKNDLKTALEKVNAGEPATIPAIIEMPEKTKENLEAQLFSATMGSYSTDFSSSTQNRADNVARAAGSINGMILMPGDTFSYNDAIGNPSLANGYKVAPVFENGKTSQGVGGGVCQVSSTLYSAVLYADLSIVERHNHSLTVSYVPKGQDATVAYGSLDFKFRNSTDYPIKINSGVSGRKLTISIIGTKYSPDRKIELSHNLVSTIAPTEKITNDATLAEGTRIVTAKGKNGYVVDSYKTVYENGQKTSSKKISTSRYKMVPTEVTIGTAVAQATQSDAVTDNGIITENNEVNENNGNNETQESQTQENQAVERPAENTDDSAEE